MYVSIYLPRFKSVELKLFMSSFISDLFIFFITFSVNKHIGSIKNKRQSPLKQFSPNDLSQ